MPQNMRTETMTSIHRLKIVVTNIHQYINRIDTFTAIEAKHNIMSSTQIDYFDLLLLKGKVTYRIPYLSKLPSLRPTDPCLKRDLRSSRRHRHTD